MKIMKFIFTLTLFTGLTLASAQAQFVEGLEDVPTPDWISQIENSSLSFGNEEIRFVEVFFNSENNDFSKTVNFYKKTLPQMGWNIKKQSKNKITFEREDEIMDIYKETPSPLIIRMTVKSKK